MIDGQKCLEVNPIDLKATEDGIKYFLTNKKGKKYEFIDRSIDEIREKLTKIEVIFESPKH